MDKEPRFFKNFKGMESDTQVFGPEQWVGQVKAYTIEQGSDWGRVEKIFGSGNLVEAVFASGEIKAEVGTNNTKLLLVPLNNDQIDKKEVIGGVRETDVAVCISYQGRETDSRQLEHSGWYTTVLAMDPSQAEQFVKQVQKDPGLIYQVVESLNKGPLEGIAVLRGEKVEILPNSKYGGTVAENRESVPFGSMQSGPKEEAKPSGQEMLSVEEKYGPTEPVDAETSPITEKEVIPPVDELPVGQEEAPGDQNEAKPAEETTQPVREPLEFGIKMGGSWRDQDGRGRANTQGVLLEEKKDEKQELKQALQDALGEGRAEGQKSGGKRWLDLIEKVAKGGLAMGAISEILEEMGLSDDEKQVALAVAGKAIGDANKTQTKENEPKETPPPGKPEEAKPENPLEKFEKEVENLSPRDLQMRIIRESDPSRLAVLQKEKSERLDDLVKEYGRKVPGGDLVAYRRLRLEQLLTRSFPTYYQEPLLDYQANFEHSDLRNDARHSGMMNIWVEDEVRHVLLQIYQGIEQARDPVLMAGLPPFAERTRNNEIDQRSRVQMGVDIMNPLGILSHIPATRGVWEKMMENWPFSPEVRMAMAAYYDNKERADIQAERDRLERNELARQAQQQREDERRGLQEAAQEKWGFIPPKPTTDALEALRIPHDERFYTMDTIRKWGLPAVVWEYRIGDGKWVPLDTLRALNNLAIEGKNDLWKAFKQTEEWRQMEQTRPDFAFFMEFGLEGFALLSSTPPLTGSDLAGGEQKQGLLDGWSVRETFMASFLRLEENSEARKALGIILGLKGLRVNGLTQQDLDFIEEKLDSEVVVRKNGEEKRYSVSEMLNESRATNSQKMKRQLELLKPVFQQVAKAAGVDYGVARTMFEYVEIFGGSARNMEGPRIRNFYEELIDPQYKQIGLLTEEKRRIMERYREGEWLNGFWGLVDDEGNSLTNEDLEGTGLMQNGIVDADKVTLAEHLAKEGVDGWLEATAGLGASKVKGMWSKETILGKTFRTVVSKAKRTDRKYQRVEAPVIAKEIATDLQVLGLPDPDTILSQEKLDRLERMNIEGRIRSKALPGLLSYVPDYLTNPNSQTRQALDSIPYIHYPLEVMKYILFPKKKRP